MSAEDVAPGSRRIEIAALGLRVRYPGVQMFVEWLEHGENYEGWRIDFVAPDLQTLVQYGLATPAEFETNQFPKDEFGCFRGGYADSTGHTVFMHVPHRDWNDDRDEKRIQSKKMQRQVAVLLKRAFALPRRRQSTL